MVSVTDRVQGVRETLSTDSDSSVATYLILAGVVLFVLPEPVTSVVGAVLLVVGVIVWLIAAAI